MVGIREASTISENSWRSSGPAAKADVKFPGGRALHSPPALNMASFGMSSSPAARPFWNSKMGAFVLDLRDPSNFARDG